MKKKFNIVVALLSTILLFSSCITPIYQNINIDSYETFKDFFSEKNVNIENCFISDPPLNFDIIVNIETDQISFMRCGLIDIAKNNGDKYNTYSLEYDYNDHTLNLFKIPSINSYTDLKFAELINFINNKDFIPLLYTGNAEKTNEYELRTDGKYQDLSTGFDPSLPNEYVYYLYEKGTYKKITEYQKEIPNCAVIYLSAYSRKAVEIKGITKVIILYSQSN